MLYLLLLIPLMPLLGFIILTFAGRRLPQSTAGMIGCGSVGLAMLSAFSLILGFFTRHPEGHDINQVYWTWLRAGGFSADFGLYLDPLSLLMVLVVTAIGFLIHIYSLGYMAEDEGFRRFFAYMNLFVFSMLVLVLADNLLLLYLGWEGVGLCSYLLIGFWYQDPANGRAARKAFIVTRVGDTGMAIGLFILFYQFGTLNIQSILHRAPNNWVMGSSIAFVVAVLLVMGAVGKSAQLPLQTWLPDAMAGPTPVSALIHAATMVTAGVYLIARTHPIFLFSPAAMHLVAVIGTITLLLAGFSALVQSDIKRVLAYSTISQIGYMFLALGVGAWSATMFHFMTHAFFKALLFLGAGAVIHALHHEQNLFRMGGLKEKLPVVYFTFLAGAASLSALPLISAGFYSKDQILWNVFSLPQGNYLLFAGAILGAFLTAIYTFRMVFLVFWGTARTEVSRLPGRTMTVPLVILAVFAIAVGLIELPRTMGNFSLFGNFMQSVFPKNAVEHGPISPELLVQLLSSVVILSGLYAAYELFVKNPQKLAALLSRPLIKQIHLFWFSGWGFDWVYNLLLIRPLLFFVRINKEDAVDKIYSGIADISCQLNRLLLRTQTGRIRWYVLASVAGAILFLALAVSL